jgi:exonuclease VII large subunit
MSTELPPMPRFVSDEHDARYEFSVPRTTYEDLRDEYVDLRARLQEEIAKRGEVERERDNFHERWMVACKQITEQQTKLNSDLNWAKAQRDVAEEKLKEAESRAAALQKELEAVTKDRDRMRKKFDQLLPGEHVWRSADSVIKWPHCAICGIIKRADGENSRCKGAAQIGLRDAALSKESPE